MRGKGTRQRDSRRLQDGLQWDSMGKGAELGLVESQRCWCQVGAQYGTLVPSLACSHSQGWELKAALVRL